MCSEHSKGIKTYVETFRHEIRKIFDKYWIVPDIFSNVLGRELFKLWDLTPNLTCSRLSRNFLPARTFFAKPAVNHNNWDSVKEVPESFSIWDFCRESCLCKLFTTGSFQLLMGQFNLLIN